MLCRFAFIYLSKGVKPYGLNSLYYNTYTFVRCFEALYRAGPGHVSSHVWQMLSFKVQKFDNKVFVFFFINVFVYLSE